MHIEQIPGTTLAVSTASSLQRDELLEGAPVLCGAILAMISGVSMLPAYTAGLFVVPLTTEFGWSRTAISAASSMAAFGIAASTPVVGFLSERVHPRWLILLGILAMSLSFAMLGRVGNSVGTFQAIHLLFGLTGNLAGAAAVTPLLTATFSRSRGLALGATMAGVGLGGAIAAPLVGISIASQGWRATYSAIGIVELAACAVVYILLRNSRRLPRASAESLAAPPPRAQFGRTYWLLSIAFLLIALGTTGLLLHFVPLLTDQGIAPKLAATVTSAIGIGIIVVRVTVGWLNDRFFAPHVGAVLAASGAIGFAVFAAGGVNFAFVGVIALGLTFGAEIDLLGYMVGAYFDRRLYGRLFGTMYAICLLGSMMSALLYGKVRDVTGSYTPMLIMAALCCAAAAVVFLFLPRFAETPDEEAPFPQSKEAPL